MIKVVKGDCKAEGAAHELLTEYTILTSLLKEGLCEMLGEDAAVSFLIGACTDGLTEERSGKAE